MDKCPKSLISFGAFVGTPPLACVPLSILSFLLPVAMYPGYDPSVRFLVIILLTLLLPATISAPSAVACSTTACCGPNCSDSAPVDELSCCQAPAAPDRATSQARDTLHFHSIGPTPIVAVMVANAHLQNTLIAREYSPPDRLASLALLCSRQL